jgi:uncharacterized paraquat-inducible protein A
LSLMHSVRRGKMAVMFNVNVYYCWSCDAHRRVAETAGQSAACPRCGQHLPEDARLPIRVIHTATQPTMISPAPIRPRLAASA